MNEIKIADIINESIVDGPGIRMTIFAQGCPHKCIGCHNPATHDFDAGKYISVDEIIDKIKKNPLLGGITLSGGEPFSQAEVFAKLAEKAHELNLNVITYTGYTVEEIFAGVDKNKGWKELLTQTDTLIDGPFILEQRDLTLKFRGSKNQRIIDPKESIIKGYAAEKSI